MKVVLFCHSLVSDWNHGNAHFLRGLARELTARGHRVRAFEPVDGWSRLNLVADHGETALRGMRESYPELASETYDLRAVDLDRLLDGAALVLVHEWNDPELVRRIGEHRSGTGDYRLLFHDTHHRAVTEPDAMARYDLTYYDGVLAFGGVIRDLYLRRGWAARAWTFHEAADVSVFRPESGIEPDGDLVWIGNWGDGERTTELEEFLLRPSVHLGLRTRVYGVRYPATARAALVRAGVDYEGWIPNHRVPAVFARHRVTVHVPRRPYARALAGIPTIRPFEALACGIPLVSAPWDDIEGLFTPGRDYLVARDEREMREHLRLLLHDRDTARTLAEHGLATVRARHTTAHRVDQLLDIYHELEGGRQWPVSTSRSSARASSPRTGTGRQRTIGESSGRSPAAGTG
jgi:spore maturation protein CgeB